MASAQLHAPKKSFFDTTLSGKQINSLCAQYNRVNILGSPAYYAEAARNGKFPGATFGPPIDPENKDALKKQQKGNPSFTNASTLQTTLVDEKGNIQYGKSGWRSNLHYMAIGTMPFGLQRVDGADSELNEELKKDTKYSALIEEDPDNPDSVASFDMLEKIQNMIDDAIISKLLQESSVLRENLRIQALLNEFYNISLADEDHVFSEEDIAKFLKEKKDVIKKRMESTRGRDAAGKSKMKTSPVQTRLGVNSYDAKVYNDDGTVKLDAEGKEVTERVTKRVFKHSMRLFSNRNPTNMSKKDEKELVIEATAYNAQFFDTPEKKQKYDPYNTLEPFLKGKPLFYAPPAIYTSQGEQVLPGMYSRVGKRCTVVVTGDVHLIQYEELDKNKSGPSTVAHTRWNGKDYFHIVANNSRHQQKGKSKQFFPVPVPPDSDDEDLEEEDIMRDMVLPEPEPEKEDEEDAQPNKKARTE